MTYIPGGGGPVGDGNVPVGAIIVWTGGAVPDGYLLCDGTNGTPDLRSKFVKGATTPGGTGGAATHTPTGTVSQPTFTGDAMAPHSH